tara:strand:- start:124 stop:1137 length:1014 start_codon:yes stop_codon:yes gene_type:complete
MENGAPPEESSFCIYGGYIRDQIMRGEDANDIDISINPETDVSDVLRRLTNFLESSNVCRVVRHGREYYVKRGRDVYCSYIEPLEGAWPLPIEVQFVNSTGFRCEEVDLTCNAMGINLQKGLHAKSGVSYSRCYNDIMEKQFACVIEMCVIERRAQRMRFRGWAHRKLEKEDIPSRVDMFSTEGKRQALSKAQIPLEMGAIIGGTLLWEWQQVRRKAEKEREKAKATRDKEKHKKIIKKIKKLVPKVQKALDKLHATAEEGGGEGEISFLPSKEITVLILKALKKEYDNSANANSLREILQKVPLERQTCALTTVLAEYQEVLEEHIQENESDQIED